MRIVFLLFLAMLIAGVLVDALKMIRNPAAFLLRSNLQGTTKRIQAAVQQVVYLRFVRFWGIILILIAVFVVVMMCHGRCLPILQAHDYSIDMDKTRMSDLFKLSGSAVEWVKVVAVILLGGGFLLALLFNGLFMLFSPQRWFKLPAYIRMSGGLSQADYSRGWGALQVRLLGATFAAVTLWLMYRLAHGRS